MKKLLFAVLLFAGLAATAPVAKAGQFARVYDGCGVTYVPKAALYSPCYVSDYDGCQPHHRSYGYSGYGAPYYRTGYYHSSDRHYSRPRVAVSFSF